jgi:hypothetical protein
MTRKSNEARTRWFNVPKEMLGQFFSYIDERELEFEVTNFEEGHLVVEVNYDQDSREDVMTLIELLDDYEGQLEGEEENED